MLAVWESRRGHRETVGLATLRIQRRWEGLGFAACSVLRLGLVARAT